MIVLLVVTDGRLDYLDESVLSAMRNLRGPITERVMIDDSGDEIHRSDLRRLYPNFQHIGHGARRGFGATIATAWSRLAFSDARYVFHLEGDFTFNRPVDLSAMARLLEKYPYLAQMALRRQAWNEEEKAAGGIVEQHPEDYTDHWDGPFGWLEHRRCFTTNPSLYRRSLIDRGWPIVDRSEGIFTHELLENPDTRFGFWGARRDPAWVEHIGYERAGKGY